MNLGLDNLRDLLENFLGDSGGRRGRDRERRRQDAEEESPEWLEDDGPGAADGSEGESESEPTNREPRPDPDELDEDEVVDELYHRIETLEDDLERKDSALGSIQDSQEQVANKVDDVDDTIRQLLGIYDQVTNDANPFTGQGEEEGGFGVFGESKSEANDGDDGGFGLDGRRSTNANEETVSFADLKGAIEDAANARNERESDGETLTFDERAAQSDSEEDVDDTHVEVQATERVSDPSAEEREDDSAESDVTLDALADTYATDVIVFEWLTELVRTAGPAATLRAISYYHEIGWIEADVKDHLESVLSGPDLDIHVDPTAAPDELTAEDHADSYTYIMKLNEIHATKAEAGS